MGKYSLQYRASRRRAFQSRALSQPASRLASPTSNTASSTYWASAAYIGFDASSGKHRVRTMGGEIRGAHRIPGNGAEFGGVSLGTSGLFSQGFWSD